MLVSSLSIRTRYGESFSAKQEMKIVLHKNSLSFQTSIQLLTSKTSNRKPRAFRHNTSHITEDRDCVKEPRHFELFTNSYLRNEDFNNVINYSVVNRKKKDFSIDCGYSCFYKYRLPLNLYHK